MQVRYPGRIEAEVELDDAYADLCIPRMLLQPLVENSIRHGLAGGKGHITVGAVQTESELKISVKDDGKGMFPERLSEVRESIKNAEEMEGEDLDGIALCNIERRIRMVCGDSYGLTIESSEGEGTEVTVHLPREGVV